MNSQSDPSDPPAAVRAANNPGKRSRPALIALGSAAVLAIYAAGFLRTAAAAQRLAASERRRVAPDGASVHELVILRKRLLQAKPLAVSEYIPRGPEATTAIKPVPAATPVPAPEAKTASVPAVPATPAPSSPAEPPTPAPAPAPSAPVTTVSAAPVVLPVLAVPVLPVGPLAPAAADAAPVPATPPSPAAAAPVVAAAAVATKPALKDGTFYGWGTCRHGDIQAGIEIKDGKIVSAEIAQCLTRYSKDVISLLPHQVIERQSADVDWVSGATESSDAFFYAVSEALRQAK